MIWRVAYFWNDFWKHFHTLRTHHHIERRAKMNERLTK